MGISDRKSTLLRTREHKLLTLQQVFGFETERFMETEATFMCPYCGESISMVFDLSADAQEYIEDCEVCCRPIQVNYQVSCGELVNVVADRST
jgi:formate dehydrogenase maturation protein FdhE